MFAAIPNFNAFFTETVNVTGPECLRVLNEIISLFDRVSFLREKLRNLYLYQEYLEQCFECRTIK